MRKLSPSFPGKLFYIWTLMSDTARRKGGTPAVIASIKTGSGNYITLWEAGKLEKLPRKAVAAVLVEGPLFDIMTAGTDFIVSKPVRDYLRNNAPEDFEFVPVDLQSRSKVKSYPTYYAVRFLKSVPAQPTAMDYDLSKLSSCSHKAVMAYCKGDDCINTCFLDAQLADGLMTAGFTGLGFSNPFDDQIPGENLSRPAEKLMRGSSKSPADKRLETLRKLATGAQTIEEGWQKLLAYCAKETPSPAWKKLEKASLKRDLRQTRAWLTQVLTNEPPSSAIRAFWFGLFESFEKNQIVPSLYVAGSSRYRAAVRYDNDWAVSPEWFPRSRYLDSEVLRKLGRFAGDYEDLYSSITYTAVFGYTALLLRFACAGISSAARSTLGVNKRPVAIGFDSGDFLYLGTLNSDGLVAAKR